jgi:transcriptional regulator with XRE-family HTH domain
MTVDSAQVAARINRLFEVMHKRGEPPLSTEEVATSVAAHSDSSITSAELTKLRLGQTPQPKVADLCAICRFFGVSESYLLSPGPVTEIDAQLDLLCALRDAGVRLDR